MPKVKPITGIYKIENLINGKIYIGRAKDIIARWREHYRASYPDNFKRKNKRDGNTTIHQAIRKYGIENFNFQVIEQCLEEELDAREEYWVSIYDSYKNGYNETKGGQKNFPQSGEKHSQAKLTWNEVHEIKNLLRKGSSFNDILKIFPQISKGMICNINLGKNWIEEKDKYPLYDYVNNINNNGTNNKNALLTEELVLQMRQEYEQMPFGEVVKLHPEFKYGTLNAAIHGYTWKHIPIYNKKKKKWIEPCIDYPQSLKQAGE